jgi:polyribonucleotide nucleotidyltransferase
MKDGVPRMLTLNIPIDKIGALIGPGGKNIKKLQEVFALDVEVEETGKVKIIGTDKAKLEECLSVVDMQINGPEVGEDYDAVVVTIKDYGMFVDIAEGVSGLVHVSEIADERVNNIEDYVAVGDNIKVKLLEIDKMGRLKLSAKAAVPLTPKK